jgi:hypothetical protein
LFFLFLFVLSFSLFFRFPSSGYRLHTSSVGVSHSRHKGFFFASQHQRILC